MSNLSKTAVIGLMSLFAFARDASAQEFWVYVNDTVTPAHVGAADSTFALAGWSKLDGPYYDATEVWKQVCRYHLRVEYDSPEVMAGRVDCAAMGVWGGGPTPDEYTAFEYPMHPRLTWLRLDYRPNPDGRGYPGRDPANKFCQAMGYKTAIFYDIDSNTGRARTAFIDTDVENTGVPRAGYSVICCR